MPENFECEICHGIFRKGEDWSDEDARAEYERTFSEPLIEEDAALVCSPCYAKFMATMTN